MTQAQAPAQAAVPSQPVTSASAVFIGGRNWRAQDVFWGSPGAGNRGEIPGYLPRFAGRGRPAQDKVVERVTNVWALEGLYCLNMGAQILYIGEGVLGDRLYQHAWNDEYAGKWDTFSWLAPGTYTFDPNPQPPTVSTAQPNLVVWSPTPKRFVEFLELVAIQFGMPLGNRQQPELKDEIAWLVQTRSPKLPKTQEELVILIAEKLGVPTK